MYKKSKAQIICDAVCGVLMLASILTFILIGLFAKIWHPTWIIIVCSAVACGIISIVVNTYTNLHKEIENQDKAENTKNTEKTDKKETK